MKSIIAMCILVGALLIGEIRCIVKFCKCDFEPSYKAELIYGVSMCTGIGCVIGWFEFGK